MALSNVTFEDISERHLADQRQEGIPEGILYEYKRDNYGKRDEDVREFLKDVSSFANTAGGHLIIGMDEKKGVPTAITPLTGDAEQERLRLENLAQACLEPRVVGLKMKTVSVADNKFVIVLRIPKSFNPPHRVNYKGTKRIYGRNSAGAYEYSV
jgi:predicted HTH transcriptional regulator